LTLTSGEEGGEGTAGAGREIYIFPFFSACGLRPRASWSVQVARCANPEEADAGLAGTTLSVAGVSVGHLPPHCTRSRPPPPPAAHLIGSTVNRFR